MENKKDSNMMLQVKSIPDLIKDQIWILESEVREFFSDEEIFNIKNLYLTGCGDSHMAGVAASMAFSELAGVMVHTPTSMQLSCYLSDVFIPQPAKRNLVIGLSNSGETSRLVEAMKKMTQNGCLTVGITSCRQSRLGRSATKVFQVEIPDFVSSPGVRSYIIPLLTLYLMAIRMGEVKGRITMDKASALRNDLAGMADYLSDRMMSMESKIKEFSKKCSQFGFFEILASGPSLGAAEFGMAKIIESTGEKVCICEIEEFVHVQYFEANPQEIPVILLETEDGNASSRTKEVLQVLSVLNRPVLRFTECLDEKWSPLVFSTELAMFAAYRKEESNEEDFRGFKGVWSGEGYPGVKNSKIEIGGDWNGDI